jgi:hypothetical protein
MRLRAVFKTELPHLIGEEAEQRCSYRTMQLLPGENNSFEHLAQTGNELLQAPVASCLVSRRNQTLLTSQSPGETTSEPPLVTKGP